MAAKPIMLLAPAVAVTVIPVCAAAKFADAALTVSSVTWSESSTSPAVPDHVNEVDIPVFAAAMTQPPDKTSRPVKVRVLAESLFVVAVSVAVVLFRPVIL
jgi:hypothetical protein